MAAERPTEAPLVAELPLPLEEAIVRVSGALQAEGFGILTRIDLHEAFAEKLGVSFRPYTILGACNPKLAHRALQQAPEVGLLLPCNVTVEEGPEGRCTVRLIDPRSVLGGSPAGRARGLEAIAAEARDRIERVAASLRESG